MEFSIANSILFEDEVVLVVNKPAGLMVEPDRNNYPNLLNYVKDYLRKTIPNKGELYAQHLHRLDRPVSGIVLFAKQKSVLRNLSEQFAQRKVKKAYQALTTVSPNAFSGTLENWHRKEKKKAVITTEGMIGAEKISLSYTLKEFADKRYLWDIDLHTGKFHQIRIQLSSLGCPIIGDELYGSDISYGENAIALSATKLQFFHPTTLEYLTIEKAAEWRST